MVDTTTVVLQSPTYDGKKKHGEQVPLPCARAGHKGQGLVDLFNLFTGFTFTFDIGKLKEGFTLQGALTDDFATTAIRRYVLDSNGDTVVENYASALAMRAAVRRTRLDWPQEGIADGTNTNWDDGTADGVDGLDPEERQSVRRIGGRCRLILDRRDFDNDGYNDPLTSDDFLFLHGFVQGYSFRRVAPTQRSRIVFSLSFVPASIMVALA